jgi:hypothetical protein
VQDFGVLRTFNGMVTFRVIRNIANIANDEELETQSGLGRSFTQTKKSSGPSIDPCGTPDKTGKGFEVSPRTVTL